MPFHPMIDRVLLIDDNEEDSFFFGRALHEIGPSIKLKKAQDNPTIEEALQAFSPQIIFLDISLRNKKGFECLEALVAHAALRSVPVVIHSLAPNPTHIAMAYSSGAHLYFKKPAHYEVLVMGLRKVLSLEWMYPQALAAGKVFPNAKVA
jgi:PleD family two-component response regulator